jgi:hypothetical protein
LENHYDVTIVTVRPGTHPKALGALDGTLGKDANLLACWYSEIGALNQILIIRGVADPAAAVAQRMELLRSSNPLGIGELVTGISVDTYVSFDFMPPLKAGEIGPCFEVRTYVLKTGGLSVTTELWRKAVPARMKLSPILAAMSSVTGTVARFMHIWPYKTLDERARLRGKAIADGVWPPPGGPDQLAIQQTDIYLPAPFSPIR